MATDTQTKIKNVQFILTYSLRARAVWPLACCSDSPTIREWTDERLGVAAHREAAAGNPIDAGVHDERASPDTLI
jgi:hypothetical protein